MGSASGMRGIQRNFSALLPIYLVLRYTINCLCVYAGEGGGGDARGAGFHKTRRGGISREKMIHVIFKSTTAPPKHGHCFSTRLVSTAKLGLFFF